MNQIESLLRQQEALINQLRHEKIELEKANSTLYFAAMTAIDGMHDAAWNRGHFYGSVREWTDEMSRQNDALLGPINDIRRTFRVCAEGLQKKIGLAPLLGFWQPMPTPASVFMDGQEFMIITKEPGTIHCRYRAANLDNGAAMFVSIRCDSWENQTEIPPSEVLCFIPCNPPVIQNTQDEKS